MVRAMLRQPQKFKEQSEALQASLKLGEHWDLEAREAPDFIVTSGGRRFALEVTECHVGPKTRKGATQRAREAANHGWLTAIRGQYEAIGGVGLSVRYRGEVDPAAAERLLQALIDGRFGARTIYDASETLILPKGRAYVHRTPNAFWMVLDDRGGWASSDGYFLQREIDLKAQKLPEYRRACDDVRLLVVADRIHNSGKLELEKGFRPDLCGFDAVYFFSYPSSVTAFYAGSGGV